MTRNNPQNRIWAAAASSATQEPRRHKHGPTSQGSLSAQEVVKLFGGRLTYRMLDYWIRMGIATCSNPANGSGSRRSFDQAEIAALADIVEIRAKTLETLEEFSSGDLFLQRLDYHRAANRMHLITNEDRIS